MVEHNTTVLIFLSVFSVLFIGLIVSVTPNDQCYID